MRAQTVVSLDPIERNSRRANAILPRLLKTRFYGGKPMKKTDEFGAYFFAGKQRKGKTASMLWYYDYLRKRYEQKGYTTHLASNMGLGFNFQRSQFHPLIHQIEYSPHDIYFFLVDEIQSWYPKDTKNKILLDEIDALTGDFSQLGKRQIYVLATAQVFNRINKNLREQALYMINCRGSFFRNRCVNDFIPGEDIVDDDKGRSSGIPTRILIHGVSDIKFDTHMMIKSI